MSSKMPASVEVYGLPIAEGVALCLIELERHGLGECIADFEVRAAGRFGWHIVVPTSRLLAPSGVLSYRPGRRRVSLDVLRDMVDGLA